MPGKNIVIIAILILSLFCMSGWSQEKSKQSSKKSKAKAQKTKSSEEVKQESQKSAEQVPAENSQTAPTPAPTEDSQAPKSMSGDLFGTGGQISINCANPMEINFKGGVLETLHASKDVNFTSEEMTILCSDFLYIQAENKILAKGIPVKIIQKDVHGTCSMLEYGIKSKQTMLKGNPILFQKDKSGGETKISGASININQQDAKSSEITVTGNRSNPSLLQRLPAGAKKESTTKSTVPRKNIPKPSKAPQVEIGG